MKAFLRQIRISPYKARLVAKLVANKKALDAVDTLKFTPKRSARPIQKLLQSALANAENNFKQDKNKLYIKEISVTEGPTYKRRMSVSRGRAHPILKRTSNITIRLETREIAKATPKTASLKTPKPTK